MPDSSILDHRGEPIKKRELTEEIARASMTGVRSIWNHESVASGLTPRRLANILKDAEQGEADAYLTLAEEMEERDLHYASVLGTRKLAVDGLDPVVESATDAAKDVAMADAVRELIKRPAFDEMLFDALDGLGKGYAAIEILWDRSGQQWFPRGYEWRDPRFFQFDRESGKELRLRDEADVVNGLALPAYKFIVHRPRRKSGLSIRNGLARLAAAAYMCKSYSITDWLAFAEVFGMPIRIGRHGANATEDDIVTLINAVANIGSDAAAVIPDSMRIDFQESSSSKGGESLFERLASYLDAQVSKAVLGQTMTADAKSAGLGSNQADVHNDVREDIQRFDAKQLAATIQRDLVIPFINLNFGPQKSYPEFKLPVPDPEDLNVLVSAIKDLVPLGFEVEQSVIRDKLRLPDPAKGAILLRAPAASPEPTGTAANHTSSCPTCLATARNRAQPGGSYVDELEADALDDWEQIMQPMVDPIQELLDRSSSYQEFVEGLPALVDKLEPAQAKFVQQLAAATLKARGLGDASDTEGHE